MGRVLKIRLGRTVDIPVTGLPVPTVILRKNNTNSDKCQSKGDILQFGPAEKSDHGITYSITAWNCFNSVTESFVADVLSKCWSSIVGCVKSSVCFHFLFISSS